MSILHAEGSSSLALGDGTGKPLGAKTDSRRDGNQTEGKRAIKKRREAEGRKEEGLWGEDRSAII